MIEIKSITGRVLYTSHAGALRAAMIEAVASYADLTGASLTGASLTGADLTGADLTGADLVYANLTGASLTGASLTGAKGVGDWLASIRDDVCAVLDSAPNEAAGVLAALRAGKVDGSTYSGECSCLVGTIATLRGTGINGLGALTPDADRPAEQWFARIRPGDTPSTSPDAAIVAVWIEDWLRERTEEASQ